MEMKTTKLMGVKICARRTCYDLEFGRTVCTAGCSSTNLLEVSPFPAKKTWAKRDIYAWSCHLPLRNFGNEELERDSNPIFLCIDGDVA